MAQDDPSEAPYTGDESSTGTWSATPIDIGEVQRAAETFARGLLDAFGLEGTASSSVDGNEIDLQIEAQGDGIGLLIGPGGRTLLAIQDLARVAAQRRLGDHDTRLRVDIAGYREKRRVALERFAQHVAELVKTSGVARSLDPMPSADRKIVHDTLAAIDGVSTRSEGEDPNRRIVVTPG
jgi:spoIIIJ-associated protein